MDPIQKLPNSTPIHMLAVLDHFHGKMRNFRQNVRDLPNINMVGRSRIEKWTIQGLIKQTLHKYIYVGTLVLKLK